MAPAFGANYVVLATLLACGVAVRLAAAPRLSPAYGPIATFVLALAMTYFWADASGRDFAVAFAPSLVLLMGCVEWRMSARQALLCLVAAGVIHTSLVLLQVATSGDVRVTELGQYALPTMVVGGVASAGLAAISHPRRRGLIAAALYNLVGIVETKTRGMVVAYVVGVLAVPALLAVRSLDIPKRRRKGRRRRHVFQLAGGIILAGAGLLLLLRSQTGRFGSESVFTGSQGRFAEIHAGLDELSRSPIIGHGAGHIFVNPIAGSSPDVNYVHNSLVYFGIVGGVVLMILYVRMLVGIVMCAVRSDEDGTGRVMAACLIGIFVFSLTAAIQRTIHFNLLLALLAGATRPLASSPSVGQSEPYALKTESR